MKKSYFAILAVACLPMAVQAYPHGGDSAEHRQKRLEHLTEKLNLSEVQQQEIAQLWQQQGEKFKAIHQETQAGMQEILDAEQYAKLNSCKRERHHGHSQRPAADGQ